MTNIEVATIITSIVVREVDLLIEVEIERGGEGYIVVVTTEAFMQTRLIQ